MRKSEDPAGPGGLPGARLQKRLESVANRDGIESIAIDKQMQRDIHGEGGTVGKGTGHEVTKTGARRKYKKTKLPV
jgi:hypothetical protein